MNIEELNKSQKEAVLTTNGPILIIAGAGSGKTKVLTNKVAYLINEKEINPRNILAITFTNKAAKEMKERIYNLIGSKAKTTTISTFHSFGLKVLKEHYDKIDYKPNFSILDSEDCLTVIKKILKDKNLDPKEYNPKFIRSKISNCKNEMISPSQYMNMAYTNEEKTIVNIYKEYERKLFKNNSVDFDDLLTFPILIFKTNKDILEDYQERYKYILIDEYQDTNEVQYILTKLLASKYNNICVVGDSDQSIYSFRGANYKNILNFEKDYKSAKVITLDINYRSSNQILEAANNVIINNKNRKEKKLVSNMGDVEEVKYYRYDDSKEEVKEVVSNIIKLHDEGISYNDMAIIYRTNSQSRIFEEEILKYRIPYTVVGSFFFYNRKEIKDLLSYLRVINNIEDDINLVRIINVPKRKIGEASINKLINLANDNNTSIYEQLLDKKEQEFKQIIEKLKKLEKELSLTDLIDSVLDISGMKQELLNEKNLDAEIRLENLEEFKSITKEYEEYNPEGTLNDFLNELTLVSDVSEYENASEKVSLLTIHACKGLEYKAVFMVGLEEEIFPHINSIRENDIEEERRLCYVGVTRAKEKLYISSAKRRLQYGDYRYNQESRFINEMNLEDSYEKKHNLSNINISLNKQDFKKENYINNDIEYNSGDKVKHNEFGLGVVISVDKMLVTIAFGHLVGIKKISKKYKYLEKVD